MAGGSPRHNFLSVAAAAELRAAVPEMGCHVLSSDQRVRAASDRYVYPDAVVVCGGLETQAEASDVLVNPTVVVEVPSPTTESYDRGTKWKAYQGLSSLSDYLLVAQDSPRVEHYQREADGSWRYRVLGPGDAIRLALGATLEIDSIYRGAFELETT